MSQQIRIVIADDHLLFRQGLKALFTTEPDIAVVGETDRADDVAALLDRVPCDLLLLDLQMERNAIADIEQLVARVPVIVLTASEVPADAVAALRKGARALVFKRLAVATLMDAIRRVVDGEVWMPSSLQTYIAAQMRRPGTNLLSPREEEVVRCVAKGLRNAEIAQSLEISEQTVKTHMTSILRKLRVRDRVELLLYARRVGIIAED